ncbi:MAG: pyruvate ferredoxin oxidoreductase [Thermodesulfobacteriota bacterium]|nr:pyruvate ferredoxin oxidoreductase [Thermodesulfobacteriota bacterium]
MHIIESGNVAAATGVKLARTQVIAAYPITPQTPLTEKLSEFVDAGEMDAQYIPVESEHSAMAVCIAASSAGSRSFTATSANGLLYMSEQLHWAAGARLPIVMCVVNRGLGAPWTVWNDHQDAISQRDTGWIQMHACDHQQIIDSVIKAFRLAETVNVPVMVCYDGYILSHTYMPFEVPDMAAVDAFLPPYSPVYALEPADPANLNTVTLPDPRIDVHGETAPGYMEIRHDLHTGIRRAMDVLEEVDRDFEAAVGRACDAHIEPYKCDDATFVAVCMGSLSYQLRDVVDRLRTDGMAVGVAGIRLYRPFPEQSVIDMLAGRKVVMVFEKALSYGYEGALYADIKAALYDCSDRPLMHNYILGLGGRGINTRDLVDAVRTSCTRPETVGPLPQWIGLSPEIT